MSNIFIYRKLIFLSKGIQHTDSKTGKRSMCLKFYSQQISMNLFDTRQANI